MYCGLNVIAIVPVFNEAAKIKEVVRRIPREIVDEVLVVDDGSTDDSANLARSSGAEVISMDAMLGVGVALQIGYDDAVRREYDVTVTIAGNNKDAPEEIPLLLDPIAEGRLCAGFAFVKVWRELRANASVSTDCHSPTSAALFATRPAVDHLMKQRVWRCAFSPDPRSLICRKRGCDNMNGNRPCICALSSLAIAPRKFR